MEVDNTIVKKAKEILSKRIPYELSHQKTYFFFDSKTTLPSDSFHPKDFQKLISFYTQKLLNSKSKEELSEYYHLRGCVYFDNFHYEPALFDFQQALEIDTKNPVLFYDLASIYQARRDVDTSELYSKKALELFPDFIFALDSLAYCKKKKNNFKEHVELMNRCIELNPDYLPAYSSLMRLENLFDVDSHSKISLDECYDEILRINKEMKPMIYRSTYCFNVCCFSEYMEYDERIEYLESCIEIYPGTKI
jgi:hypothetical protein